MNFELLYFRVWLNISNVWVHGPGYEVHLLGEVIATGNFLHGVSVTRYNDVVIYQCTGQKDKTGKRIFVGDILIDDYGMRYEVKQGQLPLNKPGDCVCSYIGFYCKCYGKLGVAPVYDCIEINDSMRVIGNIHDDAYLLT